MEFSPSYPTVPSSEYLEPPSSCHPIPPHGFEIRPSLVAMVRAQSFGGTKDESPYAHLQVFEENCSLLIIPGVNQDTIRWKLFPFSLMGNAKSWYDRTARGFSGDWIKLKDEFCLFFYPVSKILKLRVELMTYQQGDESLGATWERFIKLANSGPPHNIPEEMLMQHFVGGLKPESAQFLNITSAGSVLYKTVDEVREILEKVLNSTEYTGVFDDPPTPPTTPTDKQPLLALTFDPPPPIIEEVLEHPKSSDQETILDDLPHFIPELFTEEEYLEIGNTSRMPMEQVCASSRSKAFIPEAVPQIEGLSAIMSKEWTEEIESCEDIIRTTRNFRVLHCAIEGTDTQEVAYDPKVGSNIISSAFAARVQPDEPRSFSRKYLKWIDGQMMECRGIIRVVPVHMGRNRIFLDFHIFDVPRGDNFFLIGQPIEHLANPNHDRATIQFKVGKEIIPVSLVRSVNTIAEARSETDPVEEAVSSAQEEQAQSSQAEDANHFIQEAETDGFMKLNEEEKPQHPPPELKPLPPGLRYAFLHNDRRSPVVISDKLTENETRQLITVLEKHRSVFGYSLQDLKGINPSLCTHRIPMEPDHTPSREHQRRLNDAMREVVKKEVLKLLHAGIIYPVQDSEWVSPVQVVPKKGGMTVIQNEKNELIPQRTVTGWRMCIDYRKLNKATRKDHFPLPFIDEMLERLANHSFFCFLDGYSGYHQIPIHPDDQSKTTFTCPYGTFAYRRMLSAYATHLLHSSGV